MELVSRLFSQPSVEQRMQALAAAARHALARGVTTVGDMGRVWSNSSRWEDLEQVWTGTDMHSACWAQGRPAGILHTRPVVMHGSSQCFIKGLNNVGGLKQPRRHPSNAATHPAPSRH